MKIQAAKVPHQRLSQEQAPRKENSPQFSHPDRVIFSRRRFSKNDALVGGTLFAGFGAAAGAVFPEVGTISTAFGVVSLGLIGGVYFGERLLGPHLKNEQNRLIASLACGLASSAICGAALVNFHPFLELSRPISALATAAVAGAVGYNNFGRAAQPFI